MYSGPLKTEIRLVYRTVNTLRSGYNKRDVLCVLLLVVCIVVVVLCVLLSSYVYLLYYVCIDVFTLDARLLAISQYSEGPATGHLDTGFSWFPCVYKQMSRRFPRFQVATTCFSCSPPDLTFRYRASCIQGVTGGMCETSGECSLC